MACTCRYYLKRHLLRSTSALAATCAAVHLAKLGVKRATRDIKYLGSAVQLLTDVALPTAVLSGLIVARLML